MLAMLTVLLGWLAPLQVVNSTFNGWLDIWQALTYFTGNFFVAFLEAYFLTWIAVLVNRRWCIVAIYAFGLIWFFITAFLQHVLHTILSPGTILLLLDTNANEVRGFFDMYVLNPMAVDVVIYVIVMALCIILFEIRRQRWQTVTSRPAFVLISAFVTIGFAILAWPSLRSLARLLQLHDLEAHAVWTQQNPITEADDPLLALSYSLKTLQLQSSVIEPWARRQAGVLAQTDTALTPEPVNIVLIIGESHMPGHSGCYGYRLDTTPWESQAVAEGSMALLYDMVTPYPGTVQAMRNLLNTNSLGDGEQWHGSYFLPAIMRSKGWQVDYFDNQYVGHGKQNPYVITLAAMTYHKVFTQGCYRHTTDTTTEYDFQYLPLLPPVDTLRATFTLMHLYGQHIPFSFSEQYYRFDDSVYTFRREPWLDPHKIKCIRNYDNLTYQTDDALRMIARRWAHTPTIIIYVSDHGEDVYDSGDILARTNLLDPNMSAARLRTLNHVAAWVWASRPYLQKHPGFIDSLRRASHHPAMSDNIPQLVMGLAGIRDTAYYRPTRDLFNPSYRCPPRRVNAGYLYDDRLR